MGLMSSIGSNGMRDEKARRTHREATAIMDAERAAREKKTARLLALRVAKETAIGDEIDLALKKLGAKTRRTGSNEPADLYDALRKQGARPDLLGVIRHWCEKGDREWALNELRRWNDAGR